MRISSDKFASPAYLQQLKEIWQWYHSDQAYLSVRSSGTTGPAKKISLARSSVLASARLSIDFFNLNAQTLIAVSLPLDKIGGIMLAIRAFEAEARILPIDPCLRPLEHIAEEEKVDFISMVPNQVAASGEDWGRARCILIGGGPINRQLEDKLSRYEGETSFYHSYASTETLSHVALRSIGEKEYRALPGIGFSVDESDCLIITSQALGLQHLQTKDRVELINEKSFKWLGRTDNVVLSGGLKLYPEEIEELIVLDCPFFLAGEPDQSLGERLILVMEESHYKPKVIEQLKHLKGPQKPKAIVLIDKVLKTSTDKIKRALSLQNRRRTIDLQG